MKIQLNKSYRMKGFDYGSNNFYFITLNTKNRVPSFGEVKNEEMFLTEIGKVAVNNWKEIDQHYPYIIVDEFTCMPDHFHGLLQINKA